MITEPSDHCTVEYISPFRCIKAWLNDFAKNGKITEMCY